MIDADLLRSARDEDGIVRILKGLGWPVDPEYAFDFEPEIASGVKAGAQVKVHSLVPSGDEDQPLVLLTEFQRDYLRRDLRELLSSLQRRARQDTRFRGRTGVGDSIFIVASPGYEDVRFVLFEEQGRRLPKIRSFGWEQKHIGRTVLTENLQRLRWQDRAKWERAWDVEGLTDDFYKAFLETYDHVVALTDHPAGRRAAESYVQQLLNRLLFISFTEKMGWLSTPEGDKDYLFAQWNRWHDRSNYEIVSPHLIPASFNGLLSCLFFKGLDNELGVDRLNPWFPILGDVPYLNGGLFSEEAGLDVAGVEIPDEAFAEILADRTGLFRRFNFTVTESTPLDQEVAVDPEMLGKIFERLVIAEERHRTGTYYTPRPIVEFMVNEALKGYLVDRGLSAEKASLLLDEDKVESESVSFLPSELQDTVDALAEVRAVDPACGSGAYLLMLLQRLFELTDRLEVVQHKKRDDDKHHLYKMKLRLLERCIYGVDSSELAVRIAKLRLWLSLVVENQGVKPEPLPSFDFLIMCGDSLASPINPLQRPLGYPEAEIREYTALKHRYFHPKPGEQRPSREEMDAKRAVIAAAYADMFATSALHSVASNPFEWEVDFAEVFDTGDPETTIGGRLNLFTVAGTGGAELAESVPTRSGFDIVLANPPYVNSGELLKSVGEPYKKALVGAFKTAGSGTADLLVFFMERAMQLLRPNGVFAYITSNKWLKAAYGKKLRTYLANEAAISDLVDFHDGHVFQNVISYPLITIARKTRSSVATTYTDLPKPERDSGNPDLLDYRRRFGHKLPEGALGTNGEWRLETGEAAVQLDRMRGRGVTLGEYVKGRIYYGIKTGLNEVKIGDDGKMCGKSVPRGVKVVRKEGVFVIDGKKRAELIAEDPRSEEIIKPFIAGRDIRRWTVEENDRWLIWVPWHFPRHLDSSISGPSRAAETDFQRFYPAVYRHLKRFEAQLRARNRAETEIRYEWYSLQRWGADYWREFDQAKITYGQIMDGPLFAFQPPRHMCNQKCFFIVSEDLYLLAVLNSLVVFDFLRSNSPILSGGFIEPRKELVEQIPIPEAADEDQDAIRELVSLILAEKVADKHADVTELETAIEDRVNFLYFDRAGDETYARYKTRTAEEQRTGIAAIRRMIELGENSEVEFKETLEAGGENAQHKAAIFSTAMGAICALINAKGGTLLIGVSDAGEVIGLERDGTNDAKGRDQFQQRIANCLRDRFVPNPIGLVDLKFIEIDGKIIALIEAARTKGQPVLFDGKLYVRTLTQVKELDPDTLAYGANRDDEPG